MLGFGAALLVGVVAGLLLWPTVQREWMVRRVFSDDAAQREMALQWWREPMDGRATGEARLAAQPAVAARMTKRLETTGEQAIFVDVASLLRGAGYWRLPLISTALWRRREDVILDSGDAASARSVIDEAAAIDADRDDEHVIEVWQRVLAWPSDAVIRRSALLHAARWFGPEYVEPFAAAARDDADAGVRRMAWLLLGQLHPASGYGAQWKGEEPAVAEAMLWAATVTNTDDASALLVACDQSPWPTPVLPWLLSRSDDPAARERLEALVVDGNPAATLHLAERWGVGVERLSAAQQAWLGKGAAGGAAPDAMLARWVAWRAKSADMGSLLDDPVAKDGSVWAAVLLAERVLDASTRLRQSREWIASLSNDTRRAGFVLLGLCGDPDGSLRDAYVDADVRALRRASRLAMLIAEAGPSASERMDADRAYAWTIVMSDPDERMEALLALLASGDGEAAKAVLTVPDDAPAGAAMLERAWLIERFLPDCAALVAPLCPWNDGVAALQFDIMRTAWALRGGDATFDAAERAFHFAAMDSSR